MLLCSTSGARRSWTLHRPVGEPLIDNWALRENLASCSPVGEHGGSSAAVLRAIRWHFAARRAGLRTRRRNDAVERPLTLFTRRQSYVNDHHPGRHRDLLQGLGNRPAGGLQPRVAPERGRLGGPDALSGRPRVPL